VTGKAWHAELYGEPGVRRSIVVWLLFGVPCVILSKLNWLESVVWWFVLGIISLLIAAVTVGIVQAASRIERPDPTLPQSLAAERRHESPDPDRGAGVALVASMTTWAIAWLLILSTLVPEQTVQRSGFDTAWSLAGLVMFAMAVLAMCGAIAVVFAGSEYGLYGASWMWNRLTGQDSLSEMLGGHVGLFLTLILSVAAITGWLWLLTQVMRLAFLYAGWSR
jgi:hypothetical protein